MRFQDTNTTKGRVGEDIASRFIIQNGFEIVERNYLKRWGELDLIAQKNGGIHFFEVKSVLVPTLQIEPDPIYRPEENVHDQKVRRLRRTILSYLAEKGSGPDTPFHFHVLSVFMNMKTRRARVKWLKNVIL